MSHRCKFSLAWAGACNERIFDNKEYCTEHRTKRCAVTGKQATHTCAETVIQFVCGEYLADGVIHRGHMHVFVPDSVRSGEKV